jgi:hypothetical protein
MDRSPSSDLVADFKRFQLAEVETACISSIMKMLALRCLVGLTLLAAATFAFANPFKSKIISMNDSVVEITVPGDHFMKITNFTQDEEGAGRGVVEVTLPGDTENGGTTNVLTATLIDSGTGSNAQNLPLVIAGPAIVRISPVMGAKLFISYKKVRDEGSGGGGGGSPTPAPTTPVPTAAP